MVDFGSYQTKKELDNLIRDFKNFNTAFRFVSLGIYMLFLIYCLAAGMGYVWVNAFLLAITVLYTAFAAVCTVRAAKGYDTPWDKRAAKIYHWAKFAAMAVSAVLSVVGILTAVSHPTALSVLLAILLPVCLILQLLFDLAILWITARVHRFQCALEADMEALKRDLIKIALGFVKDALFKRDKGNEKPRKDVLAEEEEGDIIVDRSDEPVSMRAMKKVTGRRTKSAPTARESIFRRAANFFFGGKNRPQAEQDKTEGEDGEELDAGNE